MPAKDLYHDRVVNALARFRPRARENYAMATLTTILREEMEKYVGEALNGIGYLLTNHDGSVLATVDIYQVSGQHFTDSGLIVRVMGDYIIIERDMNDNPLVDALLQAGIPRSQIVLAYQGETLRESAVAI